LVIVEYRMAVLSPSVLPLARMIVVIALLVMAACGNGVASSSQASSDGHDSPSPSENPTASAPPLTLYVSNQSFEDATVWITISIDGEVVVDQNFAVKDQHNWITFEPAVEPGDHTLTASSDTGAELSVEFTTRAREPRWAVVAYWWYPDDIPRSFTFDIHDEPIAFQ
jgi:hypothetical protein